MTLERKWKRIVWVALVIVLFVTTEPIVSLMFDIRNILVSTIQLLVDNQLSTQRHLENTGWLLLKIIGLALWIFIFFLIVSLSSDFFQKKIPAYKRFLLWMSPINKISVSTILYSWHFLFYLLIIMMNTFLLLFVSALLVIAIQGIIPSAIYCFKTLMEWLFKFFGLEYDSSGFFADFKSLKAADIFGNQGITFFVILFTYSIEITTRKVYKPLATILNANRVARNILRLNSIISYNYLRIFIYTVAVMAFIIQSSYKIMSDVNNVFATFIIFDVILYTIITWIKGKTGRTNERIKSYFSEIYHYVTDVERFMKNHKTLDKKGGGLSSVSFKYKEFRCDFVEKLYLYANKKRRQKYFIIRKLGILLKKRYRDQNEFVEAAALIKKHILNARRYTQNSQYERLVIRLEEMKLEMANILQEYAATSFRTKQTIEKEHFEKEKAFIIQPRLWTIKDQFFRLSVKLLNKGRVAQLDEEYKQYIDFIDKLNEKIKEECAEGIVRLIKVETNLDILNKSSG